MESEYKLVIAYTNGEALERVKIKTKNPLMVSQIANSLLRTNNKIFSIDIYDTTCDRFIATKKR